MFMGSSCEILRLLTMNDQLKTVFNFFFDPEEWIAMETTRIIHEANGERLKGGPDGIGYLVCV